MSLIYHLHPATPNIGNGLIAMALQMLIAEAAGCPYNIVSLPAKGSSAILKTGGIVAQTVHEINQLASGVVIGPGNLFENNGLAVDLVALEALQIPPLLFSVSWGRIFDRRGELRARSDAMAPETIQAIGKKASAILVRDERTKDFLRGLGLERVRVIGCPIMALQTERLPLGSPDPRALDATLISIRNPALMNVPPSKQGQVQVDIGRLSAGLAAQGHDKIALLCHDYRDLRLAAAYPALPTLYTEDPLQYLTWLRDCRLNVTFRLHSLLPCALFGTPAVHLSYDERAIGMIETAGLQRCDVSYVEGPDPVARALELCRAPEALSEAMAQARQTWPSFQRTMRAELATWLRSMEQRP